MFSIPKMKKVKEVMNKDFIILMEHNNLGNVIELLIKNNEREVMIISDDGKLKGIVSLTDVCVISRKEENYKDVLVSEVMVKHIIHIDKEAKLDECRNKMMKNNIGVLPVLENGKIVGVINQKHIRDFLYIEMENYGTTVECIIGEIKEGI